jgi:hypothetical protein
LWIIRPAPSLAAQEEFQMKLKAALLALTSMAVAGCGSARRDVDTQPSRAIASDIEATHQTSPSVITRGQRARDEPATGLPWQSESGR